MRSELVEMATAVIYEHWAIDEGQSYVLAKAIIDRIEAAGFAVVPVTPTEAMLEAGFHASEPLSDETVTAYVARTYTAMLSAALPAAPLEGGE